MVSLPPITAFASGAVSFYRTASVWVVLRTARSLVGGKELSFMLSVHVLDGPCLCMSDNTELKEERQLLSMRVNTLCFNAACFIVGSLAT